MYQVFRKGELIGTYKNDDATLAIVRKYIILHYAIEGAEFCLYNIRRTNDCKY